MKPAPNRLAIVLSFLAIYLIWGSTYLAIKVGVETIPPFLMAGSRHLVAGVIMLVAAIFIGATRPSFNELKGAAMVGVLLLLGGNGLVSWAEQSVDSGFASLIISTTPFFMLLFDRLGPAKQAPSLGSIAGLIVGFAGVILLIGPSNLLTPGSVDWVGVGMLLIATGSWALGSMVARYHAMPTNPVMSTAMQMLSGSAAVLIVSLVMNEPADFHLSQVSAASFWSWIYLIIAGSIVGFSAFVYLMRHVSPARVSTYAYVNPVVAVLLGWWLGNEPLTAGMIAGGVLILGSVAVISVLKGR